MMKINDFFSVYRYQRFPEMTDFQLCEKVVCKDGFTMSVQASAAHYCSPRQAFEGPYTSFEVGFPSEVEELMLEYAEDKETPTDTVYGWVPADIIDAVVEKHGGYDFAKINENMIKDGRPLVEKVTTRKIEFEARGHTKDEIIEIIEAIKKK